MKPLWNTLSLMEPIKFVYSKKATKFCKIFTLLLSIVHKNKSKVKISQNFVAFSEYMNFKDASKSRLILQLMTKHHDLQEAQKSSGGSKEKGAKKKKNENKDDTIAK